MINTWCFLMCCQKDIINHAHLHPVFFCIDRAPSQCLGHPGCSAALPRKSGILLFDLDQPDLKGVYMLIVYKLIVYRVVTKLLSAWSQDHSCRSTSVTSPSGFCFIQSLSESEVRHWFSAMSSSMANFSCVSPIWPWPRKNRIGPDND